MNHRPRGKAGANNNQTEEQVTKEQISECLSMLVGAMLELEQAKDDYKLKETAALETYEFSAVASKAIKQIAKAQMKGKLEEVEKMTSELSAMIAVVQEVTAAR